MFLTLSPNSINPIPISVSLGARFTIRISPALFSLCPSPPRTSIQLRPTLQFPLHRHKSPISATNFDRGEGLGQRAVDFDWGDGFDGGLDEEDEGSPWEGALVYKRNPSISHLEYCTTLERLGLKKISSELSRSRASAMGLRLTKAVKEFVDGTPVLVSVDVTKKKRNLIRLDGLIRTVITLGCNRCGEPTTVSVFSNFSLLLMEEPVDVQETINMGVIYGDDKFKTTSEINEDEGDDASIDLDDWLYFPPEDKEIDISKHIRDLVHIEITINAICDPKCKGLCLKCGINLNIGSCNCEKKKVRDDVSRPLGHLRQQMQKQ